LKEIPDYQEKIKKYAEFLADTKGKVSRSIKRFLESYLKGKEVTSPVYRFMHIIATSHYIKRWDYSRTIKEYNDISDSAKLVADAIFSEWEKIRTKNNSNYEMVREELRASLYNQPKYNKFLAWMREHLIIKMEAKTDLWYIISDLIRHKDNGKSEYILLQDSMLSEMRRRLDPIFGEGSVDNCITTIFTLGAAQRYYHDARKNKWDSIEINRWALDFIRDFRESKLHAVQEQLNNYLNDEIFENIRAYIDTTQSEPYKKNDGFKDKDMDEIKKVLSNNWISFDQYGTFLSPSAIDVVKSYALTKM